MIRNWLYLFFLIALNAQCSDAPVTENSTETHPPNFIFILADDLGYNDLSCFGATEIQTPNLDQMAKEGMKLTSFYAQPQCSPSRAALMTGCYPQRVGMPNVVGPAGPSWTKHLSHLGLHPDEETLPELLKAKGYATSCVGKWHLGHHVQHLPTQHGFDSYFGLPYSNDMWPQNKSAWPDLPLMRNEKVIATNPDQTQLTKLYTEEAVAFIEAHQSEPFFLYLAHTMPHVPLYASTDFKGKSKSGLYGDVVEEIDHSVGAILETLKQNNLASNTVVIFTSDNGPWLLFGNHAGSAHPFRAGKHTTFEGGVRMPTVAWWPKHIPANSSSDAITGLIDILPTFTALSEASLPQQTIDGQNIESILLGKTDIARTAHYYWQKMEVQAVRVGKWKLHLPHAYHDVIEGGQDGKKGKAQNSNIELALFDLSTDAGEKINLVDEHPEVVTKLKQQALQFQDQLKAEKRPAGSSLAVIE